MTNDEMNRKMEFIVDQQAQFTVDIHALRERQERFQEKLELHHKDIVLLRETASTALELSSRTAEALTSLIESQARTDRQVHLTQREVRRIARLVESHVRGGHKHS